MITYFIRRLLWLVPVLFFVAFLTFALMHAAPGGPWDRDPNARQVDKTTQELLNRRYGLDKPLYFNLSGGNPFDSQFWKYIFGIVRGDLGPSYRMRGMDVQDILFKAPEDQPFWQSRFGYSMRLGLYALAIAVILGIPLGMIAALKRNTIADYIALLLSTIGVSVPSFVLLLLMLIVVVKGLGIGKFAQHDWGNVGEWIVPSLILGFGTFAYVTRLTRSSMLEVMQQDYVRTARAKGLAERVVITRHMLRNALIPVVTILGPALAALVTGSFIIETMLSFPGAGREYVRAISNRDYSMIMATTLVYAILIALANLTVDLVYAFLDPRIRLGD